MYGGNGGGMLYNSPWPQPFGQQQQSCGQQRPPQTSHCLGKTAWGNNVADGTSQAEREKDGGEKVQRTEQNCGIIMVSMDMEYNGLQELLKKENAIMIPMKAPNDFEKSIDLGMMLAEKLDLSQYDN